MQTNRKVKFVKGLNSSPIRTPMALFCSVKPVVKNTKLCDKCPDDANMGKVILLEGRFSFKEREYSLVPTNFRFAFAFWYASSSQQAVLSHT